MTAADSDSSTCRNYDKPYNNGWAEVGSRSRAAPAIQRRRRIEAECCSHEHEMTWNHAKSSRAGERMNEAFSSWV